MAPGSKQILHPNADSDGFFFTSLFTKFIPIRNRIGKHCTAFKNQFCLPFGHRLESTSQQSATCTAWNPSWVASCIPVWRWGSLELWHRAVLADRGVQATHLLEQKATSHQSWQNTRVSHVFTEHCCFSEQITNCVYIYSTHLKIFIIIPDKTLIFFNFFSVIVPTEFQKILQLWCSVLQEWQFWSSYSKKNPTDLVIVQFPLTQHLPQTCRTSKL